MKITFKMPETLGAQLKPISNLTPNSEGSPCIWTTQGSKSSCSAPVCTYQHHLLDYSHNNILHVFQFRTKMFSNLRSLCTTPIACMKAKPSVISFAQRHTSSNTVGSLDLEGGDSSSLKMWFFKFPLHFSMTKTVFKVSLSSNIP